MTHTTGMGATGVSSVGCVGRVCLLVGLQVAWRIRLPAICKWWRLCTRFTLSTLQWRPILSSNLF